MNMIRYEKFSENLLLVLEQLQERSLYTPKNKSVEYMITQASKDSSITPEDELAVLKMLEAWKTLTIKRDGDTLHIHILPAKFDELCRIVHNADEDKLDTKKLRAILDEWSNAFPVNESLGFDAWQLKKKRPPSLKKITSSNISTPINIYYNKETGIGCVNNKEFKFKDHQPEYRVFARLYENINKKTLRYDILELAHFYEDGEEPDPARKSAETEKINAIAKEIRKRTGLNTQQLALNNGNLTLVGTITKLIPN